MRDTSIYFLWQSSTFIGNTLLCDLFLQLLAAANVSMESSENEGRWKCEHVVFENFELYSFLFYYFRLQLPPPTLTFICSPHLSAFENCYFLKAGRKGAYGKEKIPSPPAVYSLLFLLTWQRDNPSRFTSSEFTFTTFRTTYLIHKSYMGVWYPSRISGASTFSEVFAGFFLPPRREQTIIRTIRLEWAVGTGVLSFLMRSLYLSTIRK